MDVGVEALKKVKEQIKQYRQSVLKSAFEGKLTADWRLRMLNDELRMTELYLVSQALVTCHEVLSYTLLNFLSR